MWRCAHSLKVRNLLQNVAVGVERPRLIDPTKIILAGVKGNLCVDEIPGEYSFGQGLAKCSVTGTATKRLGPWLGDVRIHPVPHSCIADVLLQARLRRSEQVNRLSVNASAQLTKSKIEWLLSHLCDISGEDAGVSLRISRGRPLLFFAGGGRSGDGYFGGRPLFLFCFRIYLLFQCRFSLIQKKVPDTIGSRRGDISELHDHFLLCALICTYPFANFSGAKIPWLK